MALLTPEIFAQATMEKLDSKARVLGFATQLEGLSDFSQTGDVINIPSFTFIGEASSMAKGDTITPVELDQTNKQASIEQYGKGVLVYDRDIKTVASGARMLDEASNQLAISLARTLDTRLIDEMKANAPLRYEALASATAITQTELLSALNLFGDDADRSDFEAIVINSVLLNSFYDMPLFVDITKTTASNGNGVIENGIVGFFTGIKVVLADHNTLNTGVTTSFIIKKNALGYKTKDGKALDVEESRLASKKATEIYADMMVAVAITDESGIVVIEKA